MDFQSSETYKNVQRAYHTELLDSTKFRIYSLRARDEGFQQIGDVFDETSRHERQHSEIWLRLLNDGILPTTLECLEEAAESEEHQGKTMYEYYALIAENEGFYQIADLFRGVARIERNQEFRFEQFADEIRNSTVFCKRTSSIWICLECGNIYIGDCAPLVCPICGKPQGYYEISCENY